MRFASATRIDEALHEIEARAEHAAFGECGKVGVAYAGCDARDAFRFAIGMKNRVAQRAVVVAVTGRLHDDVSLEAQEIAQLEQFFLWRVNGRVFALRRVRKRISRAEDMAVGIDGIIRQPEFRPGRRRVIGQPVRVCLKCRHRPCASRMASSRG
jgi:hypothetical protein